MTSPQPKSPGPSKSGPNLLQGSVQDGETLLLDVLCRRYGLKKHSRRQLRRLGLKIARFGSKDFTTGKWFRDVIEKLADEQAEDMPLKTPNAQVCSPGVGLQEGVESCYPILSPPSPSGKPPGQSLIAPEAGSVPENVGERPGHSSET